MSRISHFSFRARARLAFGLVVALAGGPALAGDRSARLLIDVKIEGRTSVSNGHLDESSTESSTETLHLLATMRTDGKLDKVNRNDDATRNAAEARQRNLQREIAACRKDVRCVRQALAESSRSPAQPESASGAPRYLSYRAYQDCGSDWQVRIDRRKEGALNTGDGQAPFTHEIRVDHKATAGDKLVLCQKLNDLVMDVQSAKIYVTLGDLPATGKVVHKEGGAHPFTREGAADATLSSDAMAWVRRQLNGAPRSGQARTTLQPTSRPGDPGARSGTIGVELVWRFEDV